MAIQANRRKRKHEEADTEQLDDGEVEVPKKISKESDTPKKKKEKVNKNAEGPADESKEESEETPPQNKKSKKPKSPKVDETPQVAMDVEESPSKKSKNRRDRKSVNSENGEEKGQDEAEISPDSGIEPEESAPKFPNDFKMMHFRSKLRTNSFITGMLRETT